MQFHDPHLRRWFKKQRRINERFISIYDMLFANKSLSYIYFRLRYFKLLTLVRFSFHATLCYFLFFYAQTRDFHSISFIWLFSALILGAWWGVLEVLRTKVRDHYYAYERERAAQLIGQWLYIALGIGLVFMAIASYFGYKAIVQLQARQDFFVNVFLSFIWLSTAFNIVTATYHAGIYAITRILRPAYSLIIAELIGACIFWLSWPWLHNQALLWMMLSSLLINSLLQIKYCRRMYQFHELTPILQLTIKFSNKLSVIDALIAALASIIIQFSGAILWLTWLFQQNNTEFSQLYLLLFFLLPLLSASANWAQLFYFDWKKLQYLNFARLHRKYHHSILLLSPFMGAFFWLLASTIGHLVLPQFSWSFMLWLLPLFILRSVNVYLQIRAFANFHYLDVLISGLIIISGVFIAYSYLHSWAARCLAVSCSFALSLIWLWTYRLPKINTISTAYKYLTYYDWLHQLLNAQTTVRIYSLQLAEGLRLAKHMQIIARLTNYSLAKSGRICHYDKNTILIFQPESSPEALLTYPQLVELGAGFIVNLRISTQLNQQPHSNASITHYLLNHLYHKRPFNLEQLPTTLTELKNLFMQQNPEGLIFSPQMELAQQATSLSTKEIQRLMSKLKTVLYTHLETHRHDYQLLPIYAQGTLVSIFLLPLLSAQQTYQLKRWKRLIEQFNVAQLLNLLDRPPND